MKTMCQKVFLVFLVLAMLAPVWSADIHEAAKNGNLDKIKEILTANPDQLNATDNRSSTALHFASHRGHLDIVKFLLAKGADIHIKDVDGDTPHYWAIQGGKKDITALLLKKGLDVNSKNNRGDSPLHYAARFGHKDLAEFLLSKGATLQAQNDEGWNMLHSAAWSNSKEIIEFFIQKGIPVNAKAKYGRTPLLISCFSCNPEVVAAFLKGGAELNPKGEEDWSPLFLAIRRGHKKVAFMLLKAGADPNDPREKTKQTLLHTASLKGYGDIAAALLKKGADLNAADAHGKTPYEYACRFGHHKLAKLLADNGAEVQEKKFKKSEALLQKKLDQGTAIIWYLEHSGWAVKTANHFLVFDYYHGATPPDEPGLSNGYINPQDIKDQNVVVFSSHAHGDHYIPQIFDWKKDIKNISYCMGFKPENQEGYILMGPREKKKIGDVKVLTIESNDSGVGFVVVADGVTIFHSGDHANRKQDFSGPFKKEIDFLAEKGVQPDIFFAPVSGCGFGDLEAVKKGVYYTVKKLSPRSVFPMHAGDGGDRYIQFAKEAAKKGMTTPMCCAAACGDVFAVTPEKIKGAMAFKKKCKQKEKIAKKSKKHSSCKSSS